MMATSSCIQSGSDAGTTTTTETDTSNTGGEDGDEGRERRSTERGCNTTRRGREFPCVLPPTQTVTSPTTNTSFSSTQVVREGSGRKSKSSVKGSNVNPLLKVNCDASNLSTTTTTTSLSSCPGSIKRGSREGRDGRESNESNRASGGSGSISPSTSLSPQPTVLIRDNSLASMATSATKVIGWKSSKTFSKTLSSIEVPAGGGAVGTSVIHRLPSQPHSSSSSSTCTSHYKTTSSSRPAAIRIQMMEPVGPSAYSLSLQAQRTPSEQWKLLKNRLMRKKSAEDTVNPFSPEVIEKMRQSLKLSSPSVPPVIISSTTTTSASSRHTHVSPSSGSPVSASGEDGIVFKTNELKRLLKADTERSSAGNEIMIPSNRSSNRSSFDGVSDGGDDRSNILLLDRRVSCSSNSDHGSTSGEKSNSLGNNNKTRKTTVTPETCFDDEEEIKGMRDTSCPPESASSSCDAASSQVKWDEFIAILSLATTTRNHYHRRQDIETLSDNESADLEKLDRRNHDMIVNRAFDDDGIPGERDADEEIDDEEDDNTPDDKRNEVDRKTSGSSQPEIPKAWNLQIPLPVLQQQTKCPSKEEEDRTSSSEDESESSLVKHVVHKRSVKQRKKDSHASSKRDDYEEVARTVPGYDAGGSEYDNSDDYHDDDHHHDHFEDDHERPVSGRYHPSSPRLSSLHPNRQHNIRHYPASRLHPSNYTRKSPAPSNEGRRILQSPLRFEPQRERPPPAVHHIPPTSSSSTPSLASTVNPLLMKASFSSQAEQLHSITGEDDGREGGDGSYSREIQGGLRSTSFDEADHKNLAGEQEQGSHPFGHYGHHSMFEESGGESGSSDSGVSSSSGPQYEFDIPKDSFQKEVVTGDFSTFAKLPRSFESLIQSDASFLDTLSPHPTSDSRNNYSKNLYMDQGSKHDFDSDPFPSPETDFESESGKENNRFQASSHSTPNSYSYSSSSSFSSPSGSTPAVIASKRQQPSSLSQDIRKIHHRRIRGSSSLPLSFQRNGARGDNEDERNNRQIMQRHFNHPKYMMQGTSNRGSLDHSLQSPMQDKQLHNNVVTAAVVSDPGMAMNGGQKSMLTNFVHPLTRIHQYERRSSSLPFDATTTLSSSSPSKTSSSSVTRSSTSKDLNIGQKRKGIPSKVDSEDEDTSEEDDNNNEDEAGSSREIRANKRRRRRGGSSSEHNRNGHLFSKRMGLLPEEMDSSHSPISSLSSYEWSTHFPSSGFTDSHASSPSSPDSLPSEEPASPEEEVESNPEKDYIHNWTEDDVEPKTAADFEYYFQTHHQRRRRGSTTTTTTTTPAPPLPPPPSYPTIPTNPYTTTTPAPPNKEIIAQVRLIKTGNPAVDQTVRRHGEISVKYHSEPVILSVIQSPPSSPYTTPAPYTSVVPYTVESPPSPPASRYPTTTTTTTTTPAPYTPPSPEVLWKQLYPQMMVVQYPTPAPLPPPPPPPPLYPTTTTTTTTPAPTPSRHFLDDYDNLPPPSKTPRVIYAIMMMDKSARNKLSKRRAFLSASQTQPSQSLQIIPQTQVIPQEQHSSQSDSDSGDEGDHVFARHADEGFPSRFRHHFHNHHQQDQDERIVFI